VSAMQATMATESVVQVCAVNPTHDIATLVLITSIHVHALVVIVLLNSLQDMS
jgi:hypothetical protein